MPEDVEDRNADVWEALLAVADMAGPSGHVSTTLCGAEAGMVGTTTGSSGPSPALTSRMEIMLGSSRR